MRYLLTVLLLTALLPAALAQENEAEKVFRDLEKKIKAANAVKITADIEIRASKGSKEEKAKVAKANGFVLFTKDNKARLKMRGEPFNMDLVSNGKQLWLGNEEGMLMVDRLPKPMPTPKYLHGLLSMFSRTGVTAGSLIIRIAPGPTFEPVLLKLAGEGFDPEKWGWRAQDFKTGAAGKVNGRDAKVISFNGMVGRDELWLDAKTLLPVKRVYNTLENMHITETYTEFNLDPRIDAGAFEPVPTPNEAEKLFRAMEKKIDSAKAVQVVFEFETTGSKEEAGKLKGTLLFTQDHKARLKMTGIERGGNEISELVSDGKRMKLAPLPDEETLAQAKAQKTLSNLHARLSTMVSRTGLRGYNIVTLMFGPIELDPKIDFFRISDFAMGPAEKVAGRDAKVITYNATMKTVDRNNYKITLWIDAETLLPVKRLIVPEGAPYRITENCTITLDPKVDAKVFELPK